MSQRGGTSAGAPQWAALIAIANSAAISNMTTVNMPIYTAALSGYNNLFHDITSGENGSCGYYCQAGVGYDYVTGLGSPKVQALISSLLTGTQILQITNSLFNSEAASAGMTKTNAQFQFYSSSTLCDTRTVAYGSSLTIQPGVTGSGAGHTTCTANQKITSVKVTPQIANAVVGAVFSTSPITVNITNSSGISQITLKLKAADSSDYAPIFDTTNGAIATPGTADVLLS